ncbi:LPS export ABC transporter periplasmic protein LptC [Prochlorococcus sp. MIT 1307]|uniref:LPS export ABC transporter periplasmic protein LptC n=1 Tax=Prochlorococcus sp. MIT 1307 TaxID=3096219 RepID=UPI002A7634F7|nr:LPS export ABC transporter periplasmic protein LptC [Prochlorococcus sp. MIT 1307]
MRNKIFYTINSLITNSALLLLSGCSTNIISNNKSTEFEFNKLDLTRTKVNGEIEWKLTSPEARFQRDTKMIRAKKTLLQLYSSNKPKFNIIADTLTSLNNVNLVLLEGNIQLKQLDKKNMLITGDILTWNVKENTIQINQNPIIYSNNSSIKSSELILNIPSNLVSFKGKTEFLIVSDNFLSLSSDKFSIISIDPIWNIESGEIYSSKKVIGQRITKQAKEDFIITAKSLKGNTLKKYINLYGCRLEKPTLAITEADYCKVDMHINSSNKNLIEATNIDTNNLSPLKVKSKSERVQFISTKKRVRTILRPRNLIKSLKIIESN